MLKFFEACNGCYFYFRPSLITNYLVKTVSISDYLKLSLPVFLKCFFNVCLISASVFLI